MNRVFDPAAYSTVATLRRKATELLRDKGIESAELDARILLARALGVDTARLVAAGDEPVARMDRDRFAALVARRLAGEPVARIVGTKEFWSRPFALSPDVLVPRPETETVVEAALLAKPERDAPLRVLDLGVGSGALLGAILIERPFAVGVGTDRSESALATARTNLDALGVGERVQLVCGNWADALSASFDLVVANPPYIATGELDALPQEVRGYDPLSALDGGADGLAAYRAITAALPRLLKGGGVAVLELGIGQEQAVAQLASDAQLSINGPARCDLAGRPRALILNAVEPKKTLGRTREAH
jgi:release factor glutamine methyltransferase